MTKIENISKITKINKITEEMARIRVFEDEFQGTYKINEIFAGDVIDWLHQKFPMKNMYPSYVPYIHELFVTTKQHTRLWKNLRGTIYQQPEECIDYIYNLVNNENK